MRSSNRSYLPEIDHLRGCAMMLVVFYHGLHLIGAKLSTGLQYSDASPWPQPLNPVWLLVTEGHSAVSLFLVLSGFILSHGMLKHQPKYRQFLAARLLRIYPMLASCLAMAIFVSGSDLIAILSSLLPLDTRANLDSPFTAMFWAVKVEMQCYIVFPALLWAFRAYGIKAPLAVVALCLIFRLIAVFGADASPRDLSYWTLAGRLDQFTIGMMCAWFYAKRVASPLSPWLFPGALAIAFPCCSRSIA
jgi:peptidoglycan/LPS O-acetylase OafA/YrhL